MAAAAVDIDALRLDVQELENFAASSTRPANQARLNALLSELKVQLAAAAGEATEAGAAPDTQRAAAAAADAAAAAAAAPAAPATEADGASPSATATAAPAAREAASKAGAQAPRGAGAPPLPSGVEFVPIQVFAWDQSDSFVSVYVSEGMDNVKSSGAKVNCDFTEDSFDLTVQG